MDSIDLDISWVEKHERLLNIYENYQREHMDSIKICYIYVNLKSEIEKVICENEDLFFNGNHNVITKERVLQIVQNKKLLDHNLKYTIDTILVYNVSIEPENIQKYVNSESVESFLKIYPIVDEIQLSPSIFIFHEINSIYFIFKQSEVKPKSILKISDKVKENGKKTKRVRIQENLYIKNSHNITKKKI
jgi:hypothetical protein